jgi:cyanophycin synthetase
LIRVFDRLNKRLLRAQYYFEKRGRRVVRRKEDGAEAFDKLRVRFYRDLWENAALAAGAEIEDAGYGFLQIRKGDKATFVLQSEVMLDDPVSLKIAGNKPLTYRLLAEQGYRNPRYLEYDLASLDKAYGFLKTLGRSAVVKPARETGAGNGITTKIRSYQDLKTASIEAALANKNLLIEEEVAGSSFRLLFLDGQYIDAVRRDPPIVTGDGASNLRELIAKENVERLGASAIKSLHPVTVDLECEYCLRSQGLQLSDVPSPQALVILKTVVNQNSSGENHSVRDQVHPSVIQASSRAISILGLKLAGVDIIAPDLGVPFEESGGFIGEINTTPGLHHHYLIAEEEKRVSVAELILDHIFSR